jgi:HK97 family phage prohead protease
MNTGPGRAPILGGYAAVFNQVSTPNKDGSRERILRGAFSEALGKVADGKVGEVLALWDHRPTPVLGSSGNRQLTLWEDDFGLAYRLIPCYTREVRELIAPMLRADRLGASFRWVAGKESTRIERGTEIRDTERIRELQEISLGVRLPVWPQASARLIGWSSLDWEACEPYETRARRIHLQKLRLQL